MEQLERTFQTGDECQLDVENVEGEVRIIGWDRPEVEVKAVKRSDGDTEIDVGSEENRVWVRTRVRAAAGGALRKEIGKVDYTIRVPHRSELTVKTVNGPIETRDIVGPVHTKTVNGSITLNDVDGGLVAKTTNGTIQAEDIRGQAGFTTVSGGITVRDSQLTSLTAKTVSGDVSVESSLVPEGRYQARSISGNFNLIVPAGAGCSIAAELMHGSVHCELPYERVANGSRQWRGIVGDGKAHVEFSSISGTMGIRKRNGRIT